MKTYLSIAAILSTFVLVHSELTPDFEMHLNECLKEFDFTKDVFKSPDFEDSKLKCFAACLMNKDDRLSEDKISVDKEMELAAMYMPEKVDNSLREKFADCANIANDEKDDCAVAGAMYKCLYQKYGLWKVEE